MQPNCAEAANGLSPSDSLHLLLPCSGINLDPSLYFSGLNSPVLWIWRLLRAYCQEYIISKVSVIKDSEATAEQWSWSLKHQRIGMRLRASALLPLRIKPNTPRPQTIYHISHVANHSLFPNLTYYMAPQFEVSQQHWLPLYVPSLGPVVFPSPWNTSPWALPVMGASLQ